MSKKRILTGKEGQDEKTTNPFVIAQTYGDALELNAVLTDLKSDPIANNFYKLKLAGIDALIKLKPVIAQVEELSKPSERYLQYEEKRRKIFEEYSEKNPDGSLVLYKDYACTEKIVPGESVSYVFYNFCGKEEIVEESRKVLVEEYKAAIDSENDREKTKEMFLKSEFSNTIIFQNVGGDYPSNLPMRYLYHFLTFGIISAKE